MNCTNCQKLEELNHNLEFKSIALRAALKDLVAMDMKLKCYRSKISDLNEAAVLRMGNCESPFQYD